MLRLVASRGGQQVRQCAALAAAGQRGFAEAAVASQQQASAPAKVDWDDLSTKVYSEAGKRELQQLRTTYLDIKSKVAEFSKEPGKIDWNHWKAELGDPDVVEAFRKSYESLPQLKYDMEDLKGADSAFSDLTAQAEDLTAHSQQRLKELEKELADVVAEKERIGTVTIDEVLAEDPEAAKSIDADINKGDYLP